MAYTFLNTRNFQKAKQHLQKLLKLITEHEIVKSNYQAKYIAIDSFIKVFDYNIKEAIEGIETFLANKKNAISIQEKLNLSLNLSAFLITEGSNSKAVKILNFMYEPDTFYQNQMGREWLVRKDMIMAIAQASLGNVDNSLKIMKSIEDKHKDMFSNEQYSMVAPFINALKTYLNHPHEVNKVVLEEIESKINLQKEKVFRDPRLILFYSWLK